LAASVPEALTVGLAHTTFNVLGILLLYVPRVIRYVPVTLAEGLATVAVKRPVWAVVYVMTAFIILPLVGLLLLR
jgi:sodium-dependent phosphate cotransporter